MEKIKLKLTLEQMRYLYAFIVQKLKTNRAKENLEYLDYYNIRQILMNLHTKQLTNIYKRDKKKEFTLNMTPNETGAFRVFFHLWKEDIFNDPFIQVIFVDFLNLDLQETKILSAMKNNINSL